MLHESLVFVCNLAKKLVNSIVVPYMLSHRRTLFKSINFFPAQCLHCVCKVACHIVVRALFAQTCWTLKLKYKLINGNRSAVGKSRSPLRAKDVFGEQIIVFWLLYDAF